jgi:hypothetical protein
MTITDKLDLCKTLTLLKAYKPKKHKARRRFKSQRRTIVRQLRRAA